MLSKPNKKPKKSKTNTFSKQTNLRFLPNLKKLPTPKPHPPIQTQTNPNFINQITQIYNIT